MKWWLASFAVMYWQAQNPLSPEAILLDRIRTKEAENLARLPDYTCSQTIERFKRQKHGAKPDRLDTIRLEVAYVGGQELFGWPGSKIDEPDINKFIGRGTAGNGDFAIFPRDVLLRAGVKFYYGGRAELDGKPAIRFNYRVPQNTERYRLQTGSGEAFVGYEGSFWVDAVTLDLLRLTAAADDIPTKLKLKSTSTILNYSRIAVGGSAFLLPLESELVMADADGVEHQNRNVFHDCHEFAGRSVVKFDEPPPEAPAVSPPATEASLPEEFIVEIALNSPIDSASTAVGDPVRAIFKQSVKSKRDTVIPKGAVLTGNIVLMETRGTVTFVNLRFTSVELDGHTLDLGDRENKVDAVRMRNGRSLPMFAGPMSFPGDHFKLASGTVLQFRSRRQKK